MKKLFDHFPNGLLIGERKEKITTLVDGGIKKVFMTDKELCNLRCKYISVGAVILASLLWALILLFF